MDLHGVPDEQATKVTEGDPPEARGMECATQCPVDPCPIWVDDVAAGAGCRPSGAAAVRFQPKILRTSPEQQVWWRQQDEHKKTQRHAGSSPTVSFDQRLQPRQQRDRPDPDPGKG